MNEIIVALDSMTNHGAIELARSIAGKVWGFKVNDLVLEYGTNIITQLKKHGNVFADPKLYDIPKTVNNSVKRLASAGADMITCHVSGGVTMLNAAMEAAGDSKILGVTMLTSMDFEEVRQTYRGWPLERFSDIVSNSKIHGVVCSAHEISYWNLFDLVKVVPGVRPFGNVEFDDQTRTCSMTKANFLVIGRPITQAKDPVAAVQKIKSMYDSNGLDEAVEGMYGCGTMKEYNSFDDALREMMRIG